MQKINVSKRKFFKKIIRLTQADPEKGLELFYNEYARMIKLTAMCAGCDESQADSIINKVLVKIWRKVDRLLEIENPEGWIYRVALNCAKDELSEKWTLELNENICKAEDCFEAVDSDENFARLLTPLNENEKTIMSVRFSRRDSFQEIADDLEKPLATVTSIYYRSLKKIEKFLEEEKNFE